MTETRFPKRFGKYILLDRLASGGMAEVYRAKVLGVEKFQRLVAIKCMLPTLNEDEQFTSMFKDEAKLAAQLQHANIVQIYELGLINAQLYIAMELVNGRDLRHIVKQAAAAKLPVPIGFAAYVLAKASEALDFAHRKRAVDGNPLKLVHRDVSPQNILVSYDGEVKVVDFGIAKAEVRDTRTRAGVLKGKFAYMAPEQVMGENIDHRADIFALGAVLYEVLTGHKLFKGESDFSTLEKVRTLEAPSVTAEVPNAPPEIDAILKKALAKNVAERYAWASDLSEDLAPLLIDNRTIFGAKQAKEFMQALYTDELETLAGLLRQFSEVGEDDCIDSSTEKKKPRSSEVFESAFDGEDAAPPAGKAGDGTASGWTDGGAGGSGGFGAKMAESTQLFEGNAAPASQPREPSHSGVRKRESRPSLRPQPMDELPQSGLRPVAPPSSVGRPVLLMLVAASLLTFMGVVGVLVYNYILRPRSSFTSLDPGHAEQPAPQPYTPPYQPPPPPTQTTVVVGSGFERPAPPPAAEDPPADDGKDDDQTRPDDKSKMAKPKIGFVSVKATGVAAARIYLDGKDVGYSPLAYHKIRVGKHTVKILEEVDGKPGRSKNLDIVVSPGNTRKDPLKLVVDM